MGAPISSEHSPCGRRTGRGGLCRCATACSQPSTNEVGGISLDITVRPTKGLKDGVTLDDVAGQTSEVHTTGGHEAKFSKITDGDKGCVLGALEIGVGSGRVELYARTSPAADACSVVRRLADVVEPKLPAS
ncbi:hypothetical protein GCM10017566_34150 [Amycolatopsis bartoniae]|uniref:DUF3558 domain-containing protein n=1 Tax=Amycolatopsis bartoniae TaxID=941986 RepID=A0A8H9IXT8_9PSEU|nr:hypothetical protein GCM10017566_34150 [Amycolatopsis bartoniae]